VDLSKPTGKNELAGLYTEVAERGLREPARLLISDLVPTIKNIEILSPQGKPVVYFMFDEGARPEATAGDGVRYLLRLSLELASPAGGVVLLEEPEMRMHPAAIHQSAKAMWAAAQRGIQVILTTHILDLIDSLLALGGKAEQLDQLACYRVQLTDGQLHVHRLSGQDASRRRAEIEEDLR
jgi:predicted ATPase